MKFLKTFLFTISFIFIFGSIMSLCGYCEAAPVLTPDSSSFSVIEGGANDIYLGTQGFGEMYFMSEEFNTQFMNELSENLDDSSGYGILNGYALPTGMYEGLDLNTAQYITTLLTKGGLTYTQFVSDNWSVISHKAQQWGSNAKEYFIGKVDQVTGVISNAFGNIVSKVTQQGIDTYLNCTNSLIQNDSISVIDSNYLYSNTFVGKGNGSYNIVQLNFNSNYPCLFYTQSSGSGNLLCCAVKTSNSPNNNYYFPCNATAIYQGTTYHVTSFQCNGNVFTVGNETFVCGVMNFNVGGLLKSALISYPFGSSDVNFVTNAMASVGTSSSALGVKPSNNSYIDLRNLLNQLIGKYVDSNIWGQIGEKISQAPIIIEYQNNEPVPVAQLDNALLDEISNIIDTAIDNSSLYEQLLDPYEEPDPEPDPEPLPDPEPSDQGTEVPEDLPIEIYTPIVDSIDSTFSFISIFEPLFYIFSFSTGLLALWLVVPFVLLFLILFRMLK